MPRITHFRTRHVLPVLLTTVLGACGGGQPAQVRDLPDHAISHFADRDWGPLQETLREARTKIPNNEIILLLQSISDFCQGRFPASLRSLDTIQALDSDSDPALPATTFRTGSVMQEVGLLTPIVESSYATQAYPAVHRDQADFYCAELAVYQQQMPPTETSPTDADPGEAQPQADSAATGAFRIRLALLEDEAHARRLFEALSDDVRLPRSLAAKLRFSPAIDTSGNPRYLIFFGDYGDLAELQASEAALKQSAVADFLRENQFDNRYCLQHQEADQTHYRILECPTF
jgi:hypothetical protein